MDIVTYAAANGLTVEDALEVLTSAGPTAEEPASEPVFQANPRDYMPRLRADERRYGARVAWNTGPLQ